MRRADGRAEVSQLKMAALMAAQVGIIACGQSAPTTPSSIPATSSSTAAAPSALSSRPFTAPVDWRTDETPRAHPRAIV